MIVYFLEQKILLGKKGKQGLNLEFWESCQRINLAQRIIRRSRELYLRRSTSLLFLETLNIVLLFQPNLVWTIEFDSTRESRCRFRSSEGNQVTFTSNGERNLNKCGSRFLSQVERNLVTFILRQKKARASGPETHRTTLVETSDSPQGDLAGLTTIKTVDNIYEKELDDDDLMSIRESISLVLK